jgi:hypothetical protein
MNLNVHAFTKMMVFVDHFDNNPTVLLLILNIPPEPATFFMTNILLHISSTVMV